MRSRLAQLFPLLALPFLLSMPGRHMVAQQNVPFQGAVPLAPQGLTGATLADGPFEYRTAEDMDIRVSVVARIPYAMSLTFLPNGHMLVVTREGLIRLVDNGQLRQAPVSGGPASVFRAESGSPGTVHGYIDIVLHPDFSNNGWLYLSYSKPMADDSHVLALGRGQWDEESGSLLDFHDIWVAPPGVASAGRMVFGHDGKLYLTTSGQDPQDLQTLGGKVLRLNDDGGTPADNPFIGRDDARPEIYTWGHRGALGLAVHPVSGDIWQNENGPNGGDEINLLKPGANYGWPEVSLGRTYAGPWQTGDRPTHEQYEPPLVFWMPAIAPSGMLFYTGDALPKWKGDIFVGSLRTGQIPGTGHLERILINEDLEELRRESLLTDLRHRIRDVRQGPDGFIYLATEQRDGVILRIEPANP